MPSLIDDFIATCTYPLVLPAPTIDSTSRLGPNIFRSQSSSERLETWLHSNL
jgi:hypothetical protein